MANFSKNAAALVLAGAAAFGSMGATASAQSPESAAPVTLTPDQTLAVSLLREFNVCVNNALNDPAWQAQSSAYQEAVNAARVEYFAAMQAHQAAMAEWSARAEAILDGSVTDVLGDLDQDAIFDARVQALTKNGYDEADARDMAEAMQTLDERVAKIALEDYVDYSAAGVIPTEPAVPQISVPQPADPRVACQAESERAAAAAGTDLQTLSQTLQTVYEAVGQEEFVRMIAPPAPAPQP